MGVGRFFNKREERRIKMEYRHVENWYDEDLALEAKKIAERRPLKEEHRIDGETRWEFPKEKFYKRCIDSNITVISSSFAERKAMAIAKQILKEDGSVPENHWDRYCFKDNLIQYFEEGKKESEIRAQPSVRKGSLTDTEKQLLAFTRKLTSLYGIDKRIAMINDAIARIEKRILDYEEGQKALKEVAFLLGSSVSQEKKKDWAFLGGLAEGIAGPGAGIAVAANAMAENQEIERRNQIARQEATKTIKSFYDSSFKLSNDIDDLKNEKKLMEYHKKQAETKVVLDEFSMEDIFKKIRVVPSVGKTKCGKATMLSVHVFNGFIPNIPENVQVAVDGTLNAAIYSKDTLVDVVCICLPLFGVIAGESETITTFTDLYVEEESSYSVKITPNKLWIVEV